MSEQSPYERLGVTENASFEEIQEAKKRLTLQYSNDTKLVESIEAAYDSIIMDRLRMRQEGKIKVPERIRFPEKTYEFKAPSPPTPRNNNFQWLQNLIDTPSRNEILWSAAVFLILSAITVFAQNAEASTLSLLIALGFCASVYFLNRKEGRFGRSFSITLIALIVGVSIGTGVVNLLAAGGGGVALEVEQSATVVTFCCFWLVSSFFR